MKSPEEMTSDELLGAIRARQRDAAQGQDVARNERSARWLTVLLDEKLSDGSLTIPAAWRAAQKDPALLSPRPARPAWDAPESTPPVISHGAF